MIVVTGATGKLGQLVIQELLKKIPATEIVAAVRDPGKARGLGVEARRADYEDPASLAAAFKGAEKVLLISGNEVGKRAPQHQAVVAAAKAAGVKLIAYTSILRADKSRLALAEEHLATEKAIQASGMKYVFLRNGWYLENHTEHLASALETGGILGAAEDGRFASAARLDYAAAAATVLTSAGHDNKIYELAGDQSFALKDLAAEVSKQSGKPVKYNNLSEKELERTLVGFGVPQGFARILADSDAGAAKGELEAKDHSLSKLIGRATTPLAAAVKAGLGKK